MSGERLRRTDAARDPAAEETAIRSSGCLQIAASGYAAKSRSVPRGLRQVPSDDVAIRVGANLRRERRRAGLTQEELARRAALHRTAIGLLEKGHRMPRADTLIQLAGALSVSPAAFFDGVQWVAASGDERGFFYIA